MNKANPKATPGSIYGGDGDMAFAAQWAENANDPTYRDFTLGSNKTFGRGMPSSFIPSNPSVFPGGSSSGTLSGQVTGQGEMTVKVEAGSSLLEAAEQAKAAFKMSGNIHSNGPGSLGQSSPDANAPVAGP